MITQDIQPETSALLASLTIQRNHVLGILEGLTDDQLRRPVLPSGWSCLGMVQHLTISDERFWFRGIVGGDSACVSASADEAKAEAVWQVAPDAPAAAVLRAYRQEIELADAVVAATPLDQPPAIWLTEIWPNWRLPNLRAVILHVITETACHAGHLDAARELIDGHQWMT
ncbi:MAG TPA: DinB family protein [Streptosporangiaceae bacterium]|nr:DinB family protein [Streptosporangiaceae bacterium]